MSGNYDRKDHLYQKAKDEGYRSRAAYKLIELDKKYNLLSPGKSVLDFGCWPGGWLQVIASKVGSNGLAVGIDLVATDPIPGAHVHIITGDGRDDANIETIKSLAPSGYDLIASDMSPKLSGIKEADQAGSVACAELAYWIAQQMLKAGGNLVMKVFKGNETEQFIRSIRTSFDKVQRTELDATRKTSNEFYVVGLGFKPTH